MAIIWIGPGRIHAWPRAPVPNRCKGSCYWFYLRGDCVSVPAAHRDNEPVRSIPER